MRAFIAIELDKKILENIVNLQEKLKTLPMKIKPVKPENMHICLKFLGEIDSTRIDKIKQIMDRIHTKPFKFEIKGIGTFPKEDHINVIWLGVDVHENFMQLTSFIDEQTSKLGFSKENRKYIPHITLGRIIFIENKGQVIKFIKENSDIKIGESEAKSIILFKSTLTREGPIYEKIYEVKLNG